MHMLSILVILLIIAIDNAAEPNRLTRTRIYFFLNFVILQFQIKMCLCSQNNKHVIMHCGHCQILIFNNDTTM